MYFSSVGNSNKINIAFEFPMLSTIEEHFSAITDERQQYKVGYALHIPLNMLRQEKTCKKGIIPIKLN
jgi:hypothetical protein